MQSAGRASASFPRACGTIRWWATRHGQDASGHRGRPVLHPGRGTGPVLDRGRPRRPPRPARPDGAGRARLPAIRAVGRSVAVPPDRPALGDHLDRGDHQPGVRGAVERVCRRRQDDDGPARSADLHLERTADRLRQGVVVAVDAADLQLEACLGVRRHVEVRLPGRQRSQEAAVVAKPQASWKRSSAAGRRWFSSFNDPEWMAA